MKIRRIFFPKITTLRYYIDLLASGAFAGFIVGRFVEPNQQNIKQLAFAVAIMITFSYLIRWSIERFFPSLRADPD